jgi:hypothetical protein
LITNERNSLLKVRNNMDTIKTGMTSAIFLIQKVN